MFAMLLVDSIFKDESVLLRHYNCSADLANGMNLDRHAAAASAAGQTILYKDLSDSWP